MFCKLSRLGLSSKIIRILQLLYFKIEACVWDGYNYSNQFPVDVGVKQGCILSPLLFSFFMNDLVDYLSLGVNVAGVNIKILLYADDIAILADSPSDL